MVVTQETICKLLPYRAPMLLIDQVLRWSHNSTIVVEKFVHEADPIVENHLIGGPRLLPGVMMIEMVGQAALLLERLSTVDPCYTANRIHIPKVLARCKAKFIRPAYAGEKVTAEVKLLGVAMGGTLHAGSLFVGRNLVAEIEVMAITSPLKSMEP